MSRTLSDRWVPCNGCLSEDAQPFLHAPWGSRCTDPYGTGGRDRAIMHPLRNDTGGDDVPTYEYKCGKCGEFEREQRITAPEP